MIIWHNIYEKLSYNASAEFSENVNLGICIDKSTKKIIFWSSFCQVEYCI